MTTRVRIGCLLAVLFSVPAVAQKTNYNTPTIDGGIVVADEDWDEDDRVGVNDDVPDTEVGNLDAVWLTWDADSLYAGIEGLALGGTGRLAFVLDADLGASTGRTDLSDRLRLGGAAMEWLVAAPGFGSDFIGMIRGDQTQLALSKTPGDGNASVVSLSDYRQATGSRSAGDSLHTIEVALPWTLLYPAYGGGVPAGVRVGLTAALLINSSRPPQKLTDDILPSKTEQGAAFIYDADADSLWTDTVIERVVDGNADGIPDNEVGGGRITGFVLFDDISVPTFPRVRVDAYQLPNLETPFRQVTSSVTDGSFLVKELTEGQSYRLSFSHPWYEPATSADIPIPPENPNVDIGSTGLTAYTGSVSGTVLPAVVGARVVAYRDSVAIDSTTVPAGSSAFQVVHLDTGTYEIVARPITPCYIRTSLDSIDVVNGVDTPIGEDLTLIAFGAISGTVTPGDELVTLAAIREDSVFAQVTTTGVYRLSCLPEGTYTVRVTPDNPELSDAEVDGVEVSNGVETSGTDFTLLSASTWRFSQDPLGDDHGPAQLTDPAGRLVLIDWHGNYVYEDRSPVPQSLISQLDPVDGLYYAYPTSLAFPPGSHDIHHVEIIDRETALEFVTTVGAVPDPANPEPYDYASWVGFLEEDAKILLQQISIYIDAGPGGSIRGLPWRCHDIAEWDAWEYCLSMSGWWKGVIHSNNSSLRENYSVFKTDLDIDLHADFDNHTISAKVPKSLLGNPTRDEFAEWDIIVVLCGHDCCDTDENLGAIRWVEGAFSPEWRFQGGRSGGEGTWDGKQDPNVVDFLPLPGLGHDLPDSLAGEMMDYTRPQNRIRIETDEFPVRLAASRFEDREAPWVAFDAYYPFTTGTENTPDWLVNGYEERLTIEDINGVAAYGADGRAFVSNSVGGTFEKRIWWTNPSGWYEVRVRSIGMGQRMGLNVSYVCLDESGEVSVVDTLDVASLETTLPSGHAWVEQVWGEVYLQRGYNIFEITLLPGAVGMDVSDGMTLVPTAPQGVPPSDLQIARLANTSHVTIQTQIVDNVAFEDYVDAWIIYRTTAGDSQRVALGKEEGTDMWLADIDVTELTEIVFYIEAKDNASLLNPEPRLDNYAVYPRLQPDEPMTPTQRDSLMALGIYDSTSFFYRIPVAEIERYEVTERCWLPRKKTIRSPDGTRFEIQQSDIPAGVGGVSVSLAAVHPDSIQDASLTVDGSGVRSIGFARDLGIKDLEGRRLDDFLGPVRVSLHYQVDPEIEASINERNFVLYRWQPAASRWVFVGGRVNPEARTIVFETEHLSERYVIFEDTGLGRDRADFVTGIRFTPNPFSPNGDGIYDELRVSYYLWANATVTIDIYDLSGHEVNNFVFEEVASPGETLGHEWDGRDKNGDLVPYGVYIVRFRARDESEFLYRFNKAVAVIR